MWLEHLSHKHRTRGSGLHQVFFLTFFLLPFSYRQHRPPVTFKRASHSCSVRSWAAYVPPLYLHIIATVSSLTPFFSSGAISKYEQVYLVAPAWTQDASTVCDVSGITRKACNSMISKHGSSCLRGRAVALAAQG